MRLASFSGPSLTQTLVEGDVFSQKPAQRFDQFFVLQQTLPLVCRRLLGNERCSSDAP